MCPRDDGLVVIGPRFRTQVVPAARGPLAGPAPDLLGSEAKRRERMLGFKRWGQAMFRAGLRDSLVDLQRDQLLRVAPTEAVVQYQSDSGQKRVTVGVSATTYVAGNRRSSSKRRGRSQLAWVRHELEQLASMRLGGPLSMADEAQYVRLCALERELIRLGQDKVAASS
jgi:hypothetical protein